MKPKILFSQKGIVVSYEKYKDSRGEIFTISNGETTFSPDELPDPLTYTALKRALRDYEIEKEDALQADSREEERNEDMAAFWEPGTEGF